jgi:hypothetical protein
MIRPIFAKVGPKSPTFELNSPRIANVNSASEENILPMRKQTCSQAILKRMDYTATYDEETRREARHSEWMGSKV